MLQPDSFKDKNYFPTINLLRGIAALLVCMYHFIGFQGNKGPLFPADSAGVRFTQYFVDGIYIFFVISGFVIPFSMYKGNYTLKKSWKFLLKRTVRIEPPYVLSIFILIGINVYFARLWYVNYDIGKVRFLLHLGYLIPFTFGKYSWFGIIYWTLAIEFMFYVFIMFLYPMIMKGGRVLLYTGILICLAGPLYTAYQLAYAYQLAFLPLYLPCFLVGILLFLYRTGKLNAAEMLVFLLLTEYMIFRFRGADVALFAFLTFFMIWKVQSDTWVGNKMGEVSYSLYLVHSIIGTKLLAFWYEPATSIVSRIFFLVLIFVITMLFTVAFYFIIEKWTKRLSGRIKLN